MNKLGKASRIAFLGSAATLCLCMPGVALAQDAPAAAAPSAQAPEPQGDEIIVTAQKREQALLDVPQSISVVTAETLENLHATRFSDYLTRLPSANIVETQAGNSRIVLRGVNTGGVGATVATYVDETPFGSATALANGAILTPDIDPFDLARVEVLRGPQGTLYGANSLGGLVKFVTVEPGTSSFGGAAEFGVEGVSHGDTAWWGRAAVNVPLSDNAAFRASGFYRQDPGYIDDPSLGNDINDGKTYGGRFSFLVRPTDRLTVRASVHLENIRSNGTNEVDLDPVTMKPAYGRLTQSRVLQQPNNIDYRIYNGTVDYDFGSVGLVSSTSYGTLDQTAVVDASSVYGPLLSFFFGVPLGAAVDQGMTQRRFTQEVRLASTGKRTIEWTVGGFYTREKNELTQNLYGVDALTGDLFPGLDGLVIVALPSRYKEYAGFANATWHISPQFDLTAGGRYSHNSQSVVQNTDGLLAGGASSFDGKSSDNVFTYSVAPTFKPNENTRIYARVAKGYRPGGPNAVSPLAPEGVPRQFGPDTTTNYEVGVKTETNDRLLTFEASAFLIDWKDIQLLAQVEGFGVNTNGGSARSKGVEVTLGVNPNRNLNLFANGSYVDAHLTKDAPDIVGGVKGDPLPYNPKWQWTLGGEYEHPLSNALTARGGISWHYTGRRFSDFEAANGQRKLDSFGQVDAHAGLEFGRYRLDAFVRNLTDARGIVNLGFFGDLNGNLAASVIRPRTVGVSFSVRQ
jgi:outer membrane receptor protein involved in Fe transport